jgi:RHS repeat-associated protein
LWGRDLSGSLQGAGGIGGLLAVQMGGNWYFPLFDHNGNVTTYADESGAIVAEYTYDAFGRTITATGPLADAFPHRFSTKYFDAESGLYYYGYRYYSPNLMRWMCRDPIGEQGGANVFAFLANGPVDQVDAAGLIAYVVCGPDIEMPTIVAEWNRTAWQVRNEFIRTYRDSYLGRDGIKHIWVSGDREEEVDGVEFMNRLAREKVEYRAAPFRTLIGDTLYLQELVKQHRYSWDVTFYWHHTYSDNKVYYRGDGTRTLPPPDHTSQVWDNQQREGRRHVESWLRLSVPVAMSMGHFRYASCVWDTERKAGNPISAGAAEYVSPSFVFGFTPDGRPARCTVFWKAQDVVEKVVSNDSP